MKEKKRNKSYSIVLKIITGIIFIYGLYFVINSFILINDSKNYSKYITNNINTLENDTLLYNLLPKDTGIIEDFNFEELKNSEKIVKYSLKNEQHLIFKFPLKVNEIKSNKGNPSTLTGLNKVLNVFPGTQFNYKYKNIDKLKVNSTDLQIISNGNVIQKENSITFDKTSFIDYKFNDVSLLYLQTNNPNLTITCQYYFFENYFVIEFSAKDKSLTT